MIINTVKIKDGDSYRVINEDDFNPELHELCEGETVNGQVTMNVQVQISPELQAVIDDAKAECEKVAAENVQLIDQVTDLEQKLKDVSGERDALAKKGLDLQAVIENLNKTVTDLEAKNKKLTAGLKAEKAAEAAASKE